MSKLDAALNAEFASAEQLRDGMPDRIGIFSIKTANETIQEAKNQPDPVRLWDDFWFEGECCCLFADSNVGKSILAVQIAEEIAEQGRKVLYFDFELSPKQFQLRCTDEVTGQLHTFPSTFYRVEIDKDYLDANDITEQVLSGISSAAAQTDAKVLIVDNLTYLCNDAEKGDIAGLLMMRLIALKKQLDLSMLIIAHTPKRPLTMPISMNDLAGSKKLANFFDSIFAIGKSAKDESLRYLKQIKVRNCERKYHSEKVLVYQVEKVQGLLKFNYVGYGTEREHLRVLTDEDKAAMGEKVKDLSSQGMSVRDIAKELGISKSQVNRLQHS